MLDVLSQNDDGYGGNPENPKRVFNSELLRNDLKAAETQAKQFMEPTGSGGVSTAEEPSEGFETGSGWPDDDENNPDIPDPDDFYNNDGDSDII